MLMTVGSMKGAVRLAAWAKPVERAAMTRAKERRLMEFMAGRSFGGVEQSVMGYTSRKLPFFSSVKAQAPNQVIDPRCGLGAGTRFPGSGRK